MDLSMLKHELASDPANLGYAGQSPMRKAELVNAVLTSAPAVRLVSERGIMECYADGAVAADALLQKIEAFSQTAHPAAGAVRRALKFLAQPEGIDIGAASTRSMIDMLAGGGVISAAEAAHLKAIGERPVSRREVLGLGWVEPAHVLAAESLP